MKTFKFEPTGEQREAVKTFKSGEDMVVEAAAGAGKTATLVLMAEAMPHANGMYVSYNKAIAMEAKEKFPRSVACSTAHSLAFRAVGKLYAHRLDSPRLRGREVALRLGITDDLKVGDKTLTPPHQARLVLETIGAWCYSDRSEPALFHVPKLQGVTDPDAIFELKLHILKFCVEAWNDIISQDGSLRFEHDHYLKMWGLSHPRLPADFVMLDEAQDANPVLAAIVKEQEAQVVLVGDSAQAIYGWRGAIDAMANFQGERLRLSQSFRFGPAIAAEANKWLTLLGSTMVVEGYGAIDSQVANLEARATNAVLTRTNAGAMAEAMMRMMDGTHVGLVGGTDAIKRLAEAARDLMAGNHTDHPELFLFENWDEVVEYVKEDYGGADLNVFVKLIEQYGVDEILRAVNRCVDEKYADVTISTAHKAKGREWDNVYIATDFQAPKEGAAPAAEEIMLAYVAVTRAKKVLDRRGLAWVDAVLRERENKPLTSAELLTDWASTEEGKATIKTVVDEMQEGANG